MAWTSPRTWVTNEVVSAAIMNTHVKDNFNALAPDGATSTSWTPTIDGTTSGSTDAADTGREYQIGPIQFAWAYWLDFNTLAPIGGALGTLYIVLPAAPSGISAATNKGQVIGHWRLYDNSSPLSTISGPIFLATTTQGRFAISDGGILDATTIATATDDTFSIWLNYPVA